MPSENILLTISLFSLRGENTHIGNDVSVNDVVNKGVNTNIGDDASK